MLVTKRRTHDIPTADIATVLMTSLPTGGHPILAESDQLWLAYYQLVYTLIHHHPERTLMCAAPFISRIRGLLATAFENVGDSGRLGLLKHRGEMCGRLLEQLSQHPLKVKKYVGVLVMDYISLCISTHSRLQATRFRMRGNNTRNEDLLGPIRKAILPGIYAVVDVCSKHELQATYSALDASGKMYFKGMFDDYKRDFRFTGIV